VLSRLPKKTVTLSGTVSLAVLLWGGLPTQGHAEDAVADAQAGAPAAATDTSEASFQGGQTTRITREGVVVEFTAQPLDRGKPVERPLREGEFAEFEFRITGAENGEPLQGVYPGVWVDLAQTAKGQKPGTSLDCKTRVGQYLQGMVGMRPMIDLNSYFVMVLNRDASISVIDPVVGITGITSLYTSIPLKRPGADWAKTSDEKTLFVSLPRAGEVAVVDLDTFKVTQYLPAGETPMRLALQPDGKYLWAGNDAQRGEPGGVTVIDLASRQTVASIATGAGHHEIAFSDDSRTAFVSNREAGTVSIVDIAGLRKVADLKTGPVPIALAYSPLSKALYVADGESGEVAVIATERRELITRIQAKPGLGPLRFSEDGRWGLVANPHQNEVYIIDAASNQIAHTVAIADKPFQVGMSRAFAYIRALDSERISMINLQELDRGGQVIVNTFAAGRFPPSQVKDISIAAGIVPAALEAAVLVVSPADATVYYYMEGMNAPMGAFRNYGHQPRAVEIANRALQEKQPGVYAATVKVPAAGTFEVAFLNEAPQFLHCFAIQAEANPALHVNENPLAIDYLVGERRVHANETMTLRFRLTDPKTGQARTDVSDARVKYYRAPRFGLAEVAATHVADGIYEAQLPLRAAGAYYVYVAAPSLKVKYGDLDYLTLMAVKAKPAPDTNAVRPETKPNSNAS